MNARRHPVPHAEKRAGVLLDQGLRRHMLGLCNHMGLGLAMAPSPLARTSAAQPEPYPPQHRYSDGYDDDFRRGGYRKRRKSLLSELFE